MLQPERQEREPEHGVDESLARRVGEHDACHLDHHTDRVEDPDPSEARLSEGDLLGHTTHGLALLPGYLNAIAQGVASVGGMAVSGDWETVSDRGASVLIERFVGSTSGSITVFTDGSGQFTRALGLELDLTSRGLGIRSQRFALVANDMVVTYLAIEKPGDFDVSRAEAVLAEI